MDEETFEQKFEAAIPVLILLLLIIGIIALNPSWLSGIPVIGDFFQGKTINVLVITDDMNEVSIWQSMLSSDMARRVFGNTLNVEGLIGSQTESEIISADALDKKGYDLIILTSTHVPPSVQLVLRDWVNNGGKLYIASLGGINDNHRWGELASLVPVQCSADGECVGVITPVYGATIYPQDINNPLAEKFAPKTELTSGNESVNIANVSPLYSQIMYIGGWESPSQVEAGKVGNIYPFVTENSQSTGGKVFYISINPATENIDSDIKQRVIINTVAYVMGVEGYTE